MKKLFRNKLFLATVSLLAVSAIALSQIKQILKVGGVIAVVSAFGKDINNGMNKLWGRKNDDDYKTKVVPIISVGRGTAIGAAQVMGPKEMVDKVVVVAQPETELMGVRLKAMIPVSNKDVKSGLNVVKGVGVSGIVDLKL